MNKEQIKKEYNVIISQIRKYNSELGPFFDLKMKLNQYSKTLYNFEATEEHLKRQKLIKKVIVEKLKTLFGVDCLKKLNINLEGKLALNIADHHQVLNHPILLAANIISSTDKFLKDEKQEAIIVISSGDVPPNNYFSKNGFIFHDKKIPLFSNAERELCSYYIPKRNFNFIEKLKLADRWKEFNHDEKEFLTSQFEKFKSYDFSRCQNYTDQISVIVNNSWPQLFEKKLRSNLPELIYLTQEEIVTNCLVELFDDDDNIISKAILNKDFRERILNNFRGIVVAWNEKEEKGTHFFWRKYPGQDKSLRLYVDGNMLVPKDERYKHLSVKLEKNEIIDLLKKKEIYPSLFTIFGVLNFYAGVKPLVGYGSVIYLHLMKSAWQKTLNEMKMDKELELLNTVQTNGLVAGLSVVFKRFDDKVKALYAYDIIYDGGLTQDYIKKIFNMPFSDFLSVAAVDLYDYTAQKYIPNDVKIVPKISSNDFAELNFKWL